MENTGRREENWVEETLTWAFRATLLVISIILLLQKDYKWAISGFVYLLATFLPNLITRSLRIQIPIWLQIWLYTALLIHMFGGITKLYFIGIGYDHLTHALSASVIAAIGYLLFTSIDRYSESIHFPRRFLSTLVLFFVMASGMVWEMMEFAVDLTFHIEMQGSIDDTVMDMIFNLMGGGIVAIAHFAHQALDTKETKDK